jgi:predicted nucleic acid-binding protein
MPNKPLVYVDSCGFIDAVKETVGTLPTDRNDDVWHIKKLMEANRAGDVSVVTSYLTLAECVAVEPGQAIVPANIQEHFRRLLNSGQYVSLRQQTPRTAQIAQDLRWRHNLVLGGPDVLHLAAAIEAEAEEFITTDERLMRPKIIAVIPVLGRMGLRLIRGAATACLPEKYRQGEMLSG